MVLGGNMKVEYEVEEGEGEDGEGGFVCRVKMGGRCLAEVGGSRSREEAEIRAAEVACCVLESEREMAGRMGEGKVGEGVWGGVDVGGRG